MFGHQPCLHSCCNVSSLCLSVALQGKNTPRGHIVCWATETFRALGFLCQDPLWGEGSLLLTFVRSLGWWISQGSLPWPPPDPTLRAPDLPWVVLTSVRHRLCVCDHFIHSPASPRLRAGTLTARHPVSRGCHNARGLAGAQRMFLTWMLINDKLCLGFYDEWTLPILQKIHMFQEWHRWHTWAVTAPATGKNAEFRWVFRARTLSPVFRQSVNPSRLMLGCKIWCLRKILTLTELEKTIFLPFLSLQLKASVVWMGGCRSSKCVG